MDVVLRFAPDAAEDAAGWVFHPSQRMEREADGGLIVRFRAGGMREMCWHLFTWGEAVTIVEPEELRTDIERMAAAAMIAHGSGNKDLDSEERS